MPRRFPLYAKILGWFFLNLLLLGALFYFLCRAQFRFGLDWILSDRIDSVTEVIASELADEPRSDWNTTLNQYSGEYKNKVKFLAFSPDGSLLAGDTISLPPEVMGQMGQMGRMRGPPPDLAEGRDPLPPPGDGPPDQGPPSQGPPNRREAQRQFIHTPNPSRYWVIRRVPFKQPGRGRPGPLVLVAVSDSFTGGGLFFEAGPWVNVSAAAIILSALLWFPFVRNMNRSIKQLTTAANRIAEGHFETRVDQRRRDELGELGGAVNQMAGRLDHLVSGQKRFLGDVAHELCSPLAKLRVALGILDQQAGEDQKRYVAGAEEEAAHMAALVNELLSFSKASLTKSTLQLTAVSVLAIAEKAARREGLEPPAIQINIPTHVQALAEPELLARALSNLLRNSVQYASEGGPIIITAENQKDGVLIKVTDGGPGVPEKELARIFDPFYRVDVSRDRATGGTGLGLAIVKTCVESCGGSVTANNRKPSGLEVNIRLSAPS